MNELLNHWPELLKALQETGIMLVISTGFALVIGFPLGTLIYMMKDDGLYPHPIVCRILNTVVNIIRSFPFILLIFVMTPVTRMILKTSFGTIAACVPLSLIACALFTRFVEQSLLEVNPGIVDTAKAMGASPFQIIVFFLYKEARSSLILGLTSAMISFISYSTVMGAVGGGGIGDFAIRYGYQSYRYDLMFGAILIMIILVQCIQGIGTLIARQLNKHQ